MARTKAKKEEEELPFKITDHFLVPKHELLTPDESKEILRKYNATPHQLPFISSTDAAAKKSESRPPGELVHVSMLVTPFEENEEHVWPSGSFKLAPASVTPTRGQRSNIGPRRTRYPMRGETSHAVPLSVWSALPVRWGATAAILPFSMRTSARSSAGREGSSTTPFLISRLLK